MDNYDSLVDRRQALRLLAAGTVTGLAGCSASEETETAEETETTEQAESNTEDTQETQTVSRRSGWQQSTKSDASVEVLGPSEIDLRVYRCANASATRQYELGGGEVTISSDYEVEAEVTISFDYEVEAEGGSEVPYIRVRQDNEITHRSDSGEVFPQIKPTQYSTTTGSFAQTISVSRPFEIVVGIKPSQTCGNSDHANTYFKVDNINID